MSNEPKTKLVNGKRVNLTTSEKKKFKEEWDADDIIRAKEKAAKEKADKLKAEETPEDRIKKDIDADPIKSVLIDLLSETTGKTKDEIVGLIKIKDEQQTG